MPPKSKPPSGWGQLNVAMNALVQDGVIRSYSTGTMAKDAAVMLEVTIEAGADQAETVQRVRQALPESFSEATVRTRSSG